ncbi:transporter [Longispora fulva]|uniref:Drug/metabolite transporter (DMT)-like permease n=1 Tax=Longispora fulva TaxID=619741 RepID=A0A8J7GDZ2_9ACTN|nr:DMT family transporter [Longispora fulva]MBG6135911.1 drug/metabolite transporter (DMT)-like permease [Longispora fulva]GIG55846.1 transporter [Longispora fulva]
MSHSTAAECTPGQTSTPTRWWQSWPTYFLVLSALWGTTFLYIKVGVETFAPLQVTFGRVGFGALALLVVLLLRRDRLPRSPVVWGHAAFVAVMGSVLPYSLLSYGERHVSSALAGILNAATPLCALVVVLFLLPEERPNRARITGLLIGFVGVLVVLGVWQAASGALSGGLMCLGAAACYAVAYPYMRRFLIRPDVSGVAVSTAQLLIASLITGVLMLLFTDPPTSWPVNAIGSVVMLGAVCTGLAQALNYALIGKVGATTTTSTTYVMPVFAVLAGVLVLGEPVAWNQPAGALIVLVGVAISQGVPRRLLNKAA